MGNLQFTLRPAVSFHATRAIIYIIEVFVIIIEVQCKYFLIKIKKILQNSANIHSAICNGQSVIRSIFYSRGVQKITVH